MEVSPQARGFSDIYPLEESEDMKKKFKELAKEKIVSISGTQPVEFTTVTTTGSKQELQKLQDDLRKAGYKKLR